jgi:hypothetical protein
LQWFLVWGWAEAGDEVFLEFADQRKTVKAQPPASPVKVEGGAFQGRFTHAKGPAVEEEGARDCLLAGIDTKSVSAEAERQRRRDVGKQAGGAATSGAARRLGRHPVGV